MAYCPFQNALADLQVCQTWLDEQDPQKLSAVEYGAFLSLITVCARLADDYATKDGK